MTAPATPVPATPIKKHSPWPTVAVLLGVLAIVGIPLAYLAVTWSNQFVQAPARIVNSLAMAAAESARPHVDINTIVVSTVEDAHKTSKLVVYEATLNIDVTRDESYSRFGVYWGTNTARVLAKGTRVQYTIDLSQLSTGDFQFDSSSNTLTVSLPKPRVDANMVAIDPARIETLDLRGGWNRWDKQTTKSAAIAELKPKAITQAQAPHLRELSQLAGIEAAQKFLAPLTDSLAKNGTTVKVVYDN